MSIREMKEQISAVKEKIVGRGATAAEIINAEQVLGVPFSESYRAYLADYGWAEFGSDTTYGLGIDVPHPYELVRNVVAERTQMRPAIPPHLLPVMNDGMGNHYCLDTSHMMNGECPVVFWDHEQDESQLPEQLATSFDRWLIDRLDEMEAGSLQSR